MDVSIQLRELIATKRKELGLSLTEVSNRSGKTKSGKPILSISTLSAVENGKLTGIKEETFAALAKILQIDTRDYLIDERLVKVAFGLCCWASPVIGAVVKEKNLNEAADKLEPLKVPNLWFTCYADNEDKPIELKAYNQKPNESHHILTANETLNLLRENVVDIAFLPVLTAKRTPGIFRIARCMNTGKGGVYLFVIGRTKEGVQSPLEHPYEQGGEFDYENFKAIRDTLKATNNGEKCCFVFPKNSIAQKEIEDTLYSDTDYPKHGIEVSSVANFDSEIRKRIAQFFKNEDAQFFVYAGWDYHIDRLRKLFPKKNKFLATIDSKTLIGREFDGYRFTKPGHPFGQMSYDCVTLESKYDYLRSHPGLYKLLGILGENVNELNAAKHKKNSTFYRHLNYMLGIEPDTLDPILNRIHWEFLIYPEMLDKNLK